MPNIYVPKNRIAIASSFEGIFNNGATECALTSLNAYHNQEPGAFLGKKLTPQVFSTSYRSHPIVQAFLILRPMVEIAEDYRTVLDVIRSNPSKVTDLLRNPTDIATYSWFEREFHTLKGNTQREREEFGKGKESLFYRERKALQEADYSAWLATQEPYADTVPQFRTLVDGQIWDGETPVSGFYPRFATSKDEESTHALCVLYSEIGALEKGDAIGERCVIPRNGIIGMETVPDRNKVKQLAVIGERLGVPRSQVWRLNDRYDPAQQEELNDNGFVYQFFLPGYAAPHEIEKAKEDRFVRLLDRKNFARQLGEAAEHWNF